MYIKKRILFTFVLLIMGFSSFFIGVRFYEPDGRFGAGGISHNQDKEAETGIQKALTEKSIQVARVWAVLRIINGVVNVLQSAEIGGSFFVEASVNPLEFLSPLDNTLDKISNILLWALGAIILEKLILAISGYLVFMVIIPVCVLITIFTIWVYKDKTKIHKAAVVALLISIVVPFAIPLSFQFSTIIENKLLNKNVNDLVESIDEKGKSAEAMETEMSGIRRAGASIMKFFSNAKDLGNSIINDLVNYVIIFILTNMIIPIFTILGLYGTTKYFAKIIMESK